MRRAAKALFAAVLAAFGSVLPAVAQQPGFPQTMPSNTVYGRMGVSSGPGQAIPFGVLASQITGVVVTPQSFGALANSNGTHGNGNDDTVAVQSAVATGNVYFPCGVYRLTAVVTGNLTNGVYHLRGEGQCSKIYLDTAAASSAFSFQPGSLCASSLLPCIVIEGLNFITPNVATVGSQAITVHNSQRLTIRNNYFAGYYAPVVLTTSFAPIITGNNFTGFVNVGIFANDATFNGGLIGWNSFYGSTAGTAVSISGASNGGFTIIGNDCEGNASCFFFSGNNSGVHFISNYMELSTSFDVFFSGTQTSWTIANNRVGSGLTTSWVISNSQIENNVFSGGAGTISVSGSGNFVLNNTVEAGATFSAANTIPAASNNAMLYWSSGALVNAAACANCVLVGGGGGTPGFTAGPTLGVNASYGGSLTFNGATSGGITIGASATGAFQVGGNTGITQTCTVNTASPLTLIFTNGILTGGTCNS